MRHSILLTSLLLTLFSLAATATEAFDHQHSQWNALLERHVTLIESGHASQVDYRSLKKEWTLLTSYLTALSAVDQQTYDAWNREQQLAFLINTYNAYTVELILSRYPDLDSIKDLGSLFSSPWKKVFFSLLGEKRSLDDIEHRLIRAPGVFNEPRIHMAVVCASIGCPALPNEAFNPQQLNDQLEKGIIRFLSDRSRNRYNPKKDRIEVSKIFDWYEEDFSQGHRGFKSLKVFFAHYAALLTDDPVAQKRIAVGSVAITHLDYDWRLNDKQPSE
ncbi:MAG: DUF547 domain-containing protein [Sedimenticola sp.]